MDLLFMPNDIIYNSEWLRSNYDDTIPIVGSYRFGDTSSGNYVLLLFIFYFYKLMALIVIKAGEKAP